MAVEHENENRPQTVSDVALALGGETPNDYSDSSAPAWWHFKVFGYKIYCYNFEWRRRALFYHDLHHVVVGAPFTMRGECQVATWEFSAGRYPNVLANLFCLPLVFLGSIIAPSETFRSFLAGLKASTLFCQDIEHGVGQWPVDRLRSLTQSRRDLPPKGIQYLKFYGLLLGSVVWTLVLAAPVIFALRSILAI